MVDAWSRFVGMLTDSAVVPAVRWPADRVRVIIVRGPDDEPDLELPPLPPEPPQIRPVDELVIDHITQGAGITVRATAAHLGLTKAMVSRSLDRMRSLGRVAFLDGEGWLAR